MDLTAKWKSCEQELAQLGPTLIPRRNAVESARARVEWAENLYQAWLQAAAQHSEDEEDNSDIQTQVIQAQCELAAAMASFRSAQAQLERVERGLQALSGRYEQLQQDAEQMIPSLEQAASRLQALSGNRYARTGDAMGKIQAVWTLSQNIAKACAARCQQIRSAL